MSRPSMNPYYSSTLFRVCLATAALTPAAAMADTSSSLWGDKTDYVVGASILTAPRYAGADHYRAMALPVVVVQRGAFFIDTSRGVGMQFETESGFFASQSAYYDLGRVERDSSWRPGSRTLVGMGDVSGSITSHTLLMQKFGKAWSISAEADLALKDGDRRNRFRAGVEYAPLRTDNDTLTLDLDSHWGDRRYNQTFFGVTPVQAMSSHFTAYSPSGGLFAYSASATWNHQFTPHWGTSVQVVGMRYVRDAGSSPIVARRWAASALTALTYSF